MWEKTQKRKAAIQYLITDWETLVSTNAGGDSPEIIYEEKNPSYFTVKSDKTVPLFDDINRAGVSEMSVSIFNFALTEDSEDTRPQQRTQHAAQPEDDDESCCHCCHYVSDDHGDE